MNILYIYFWHTYKLIVVKYYIFAYGYNTGYQDSL